MVEYPCAARDEGGSWEKLHRTNLQTLAQCMIVPGSIQLSSRIAVRRLEALGHLEALFRVGSVPVGPLSSRWQKHVRSLLIKRFQEAPEGSIRGLEFRKGRRLSWR